MSQDDEVDLVSSGLDDMVKKIKDAIALSEDPKNMEAHISVMSYAIRDIYGCNKHVANMLTVALFRLAGLVK